MGKGVSREQKEREEDLSALTGFLKDGDQLDSIWAQFDKDGSGTIDSAEFNKLIYSSLLSFCKMRNPDVDCTEEELEPFTNRLAKELKPQVDADGNGLITRDEFSEFGNYLNAEYERLKAELEG